jgi:hypothetical protein
MNELKEKITGYQKDIVRLKKYIQFLMLIYELAEDSVVK